eukprot:CAMPEP_0117461726 /NCGR_PEP_ID=MMETSP0784-20121206/2677_1 /TAXON_ID=39447 /ORGANISM="" /LENGTH=119 /DNA_ID=CAMNT_0005255449 /DNA_START=623 /DNA_END=978 /DNA_ORIENTATION=-
MNLKARSSNLTVSPSTSVQDARDEAYVIDAMGVRPVGLDPVTQPQLVPKDDLCPSFIALAAAVAPFGRAIEAVGDSAHLFAVRRLQTAGTSRVATSATRVPAVGHRKCLLELGKMEERL